MGIVFGRLNGGRRRRRRPLHILLRDRKRTVYVIGKLRDGDITKCAGKEIDNDGDVIDEGEGCWSC